ncbi:flagellin N-terminal helical domain-containing protein [Kluyvera intermedia]|uniref:Flagellin n=1 Tax=Kluyvera intermedia TaxID=61648 RepID=A0ABX6DR55_KLUIN|nr:flagellin [Kluyvera intermedia]QGH29651.1 flagellin FliC [Kluyvera intermedia]QGH38633.1 flagellin FliC [Kluyvera intermedia]
MAQVINTNSLSLITQNNINKNQSALSSSIERLSSGLRINSAKDDAAGQAIANRFTSNIKGLTQAARNANDGISVAQTTEGSLSEINNNLQRIRELTVQASTGTNSESDLSSIQDEIKSRLTEIDRVSNQTQFNGVNVLAKDGKMNIQVGANDGQTITIDLKKIDSATLGLTGFDVSTKANISTTAVTGAGTSTTTYTDSATAIGNVDLSSLDTGATLGNIFLDETDGSYYATVSGSNTPTENISYSINVNPDGTASLGGAAPTPAGSKDLGVAAKVQTASTVTTPGPAADVTAAKATLATAGVDTTDLKLVQLSSTDSAGKVTSAGYGLQNSKGEIYATDYDGTNTAAVADAKTIDYTDASGNAVTGAAITLGGSDGKTGLVTADGKTYKASELSGKDLSDAATTVQAVANNAKPLAALDDAIAMVDKFRSSLGAVQNQLDSAVTNLNNTTTNLSEAQSRIQDADYATEVSNMSKAQIIQQAGNSVLAKANQVPQQVLSLLQG